MKTVVITFFSVKGIVYFKFISQGEIVNWVYYVEILKWLLEAACRKRPKLRPSDWILCHDIPGHKIFSFKHFLAQKSIIEMEHPPFSPDLALNYFWLFPEIKSTLKGQRFQDIEDIKKKVMMALKVILQQEFQKYFQQWQHH